MAVLFSGIVMSQYTHFNLSPVTQVTVQQTMRTVAFMAGEPFYHITSNYLTVVDKGLKGLFSPLFAETVVFLYIGMQVFTITTSFSIGLIIWSLVGTSTLVAMAIII